MLELAQMPTTAVSVLLQRLEAERAQRGLTQKAFSKLIGLDPGDYANYKNEREPWDPKISTVGRISDALRLPLCYLLSDEEPKLSPEKQSALEAGERFLALAADTLRNRGRR
jgi:transcriptional regulator with XRE-family HTH domain